MPVKNPNQLRDVRANVDPAKKDTADLMATVAPLGFGGLLGANALKDEQLITTGTFKNGRKVE